jgi:hypothetical protein
MLRWLWRVKLQLFVETQILQRLTIIKGRILLQVGECGGGGRERKGIWVLHNFHLRSAEHYSRFHSRPPPLFHHKVPAASSRASGSYGTKTTLQFPESARVYALHETRMKLTLRPEWRLRPLTSFLGFLDIKTGVTVAILFAVSAQLIAETIP